MGYVHDVTAGGCSELYYVNTEMFKTDAYGAVYLLDDDRPAVIETGVGTNYERILDGLAEVGVDPDDLAAIVVTHVHLDHAGGAGHLVEACPNADVYVPAAGARFLVDPSGLVEGTKRAVGDRWRYYAEPRPVPEDRLVELEGGDVVDLGTHELRVHEAPGHAFHQVVYEDPANEAVFTGDAAGLWVPDERRIYPTSPPPGFDLEQCLDDVETLQGLDPEVLLYTHFGPREVGDDAAAALEAYADVLREWVATVEAKREALADDEAVVEHLAERVAPVEGWGAEATRAEVAMNVAGVLTYLDGAR